MSAIEIQCQNNKPSSTVEEDPHKTMASPNNNSSPYELIEEGSKPKESKSNKLTLIPLIFLIYFEVSGGPFGEEPAVKAAGPLYAILGFLIFPFIWSIPEALITAELATAYPGNGGYVIWANEAFGPFWGFQVGSQKFLSGVINNAAYPVLCVDYLKLVWKVFEKGWPRKVAISASTLLLSFLNYTGITVVGYTAVALGLVSLCPFVLMAFFSIPKLHPRRWLSTPQRRMDKESVNLYINTLFWNLNFWDNASTLAGEVENPQKTFPKALFSSGILTILGYIVPLLAVTGSLSLDQDQWEDGFLADAAAMIAGDWLKFWVEVGAVLSAIGLFQAQLSSCSYQLLGMADLGFLPKIFGLRSKWFNTPWVGILLCSLVTLAVSYNDFTVIISSANFVYSLSMLLEFATFLWLRKKRPNLKRPYKVPLGLPALIVMCLIPTGFLIFVMCVSTKKVAIIGASLTAAGVLIYGLVKLCKSQSWLEFNEYKKDDDEK